MINRVIALAALLALAAGCKHEASGPSTVTASGGGRTIKAVVYGPVWVEPPNAAKNCAPTKAPDGLGEVKGQPDQFIVLVQGHKIVIEKDRLLVDKNEAAKFPAAATNFSVAYSNGALNVTADGADVLATTLAK